MLTWFNLGIISPTLSAIGRTGAWQQFKAAFQLQKSRLQRLASHDPEDPDVGSVGSLMLLGSIAHLLCASLILTGWLKIAQYGFLIVFTKTAHAAFYHTGK